MPFGIGCRGVEIHRIEEAEDAIQSSVKWCGVRHRRLGSNSGLWAFAFGVGVAFVVHQLSGIALGCFDRCVWRSRRRQPFDLWLRLWTLTKPGIQRISGKRTFGVARRTEICRRNWNARTTSMGIRYIQGIYPDFGTTQFGQPRQYGWVFFHGIRLQKVRWLFFWETKTLQRVDSYLSRRYWGVGGRRGSRDRRNNWRRRRRQITERT